jgi:cyclophilin family peptidyl-prolyl cis-trans isomerase
VFIMAMIGGLGAVGLAPGLGSTSTSQAPEIDEEDLPEIVETPEGLPTFGAPEKTIDVTQGYNAVITTDAGDIGVALSPDAPEAGNSVAFLASQNFYDGLQFFWVLPEFDAQTGDPTCTSRSEFSCTGAGGPGYTLLKEGDSATAGQWAVIAPVTTPGGDQVHGSQFVIAMAEGEFEGTAFGEVVEGQEILEALQQRVPCFGSEPSESNPCQTDEELPAALTIVDIVVQPA